MSSLVETIVVGVVVAVAGVWAVGAVWRAVRGGKGCSTCSSSEDCPMVEQQNKKITELNKLEQCGPKTFDCSSHNEKSDKT